MASRFCEPCKARWPYRNRFFTCPYCGGPTMWSSAHPMDSAEADIILDSLKEFRADMSHLESVVGSTKFTTAEVFSSQRHRRPTA